MRWKPRFPAAPASTTSPGPVLTANAELCPKTAPRAGLVLADRPLLARMAGGIEEDRLEEIGIADLDAPEWGDAVRVREGEVPCFWACGVTPQSAILASDAPPPIAITHAAGHMLVLDALNDELASG